MNENKLSQKANYETKNRYFELLSTLWALIKNIWILVVYFKPFNWFEQSTFRELAALLRSTCPGGSQRTMLIHSVSMLTSTLHQNVHFQRRKHLKLSVLRIKTFTTKSILGSIVWGNILFYTRTWQPSIVFCFLMFWPKFQCNVSHKTKI